MEVICRSSAIRSSKQSHVRLFAELRYEHVDLGQLLGASACNAVQSGVPLPSGFSGCMQT